MITFDSETYAGDSFLFLAPCDLIVRNGRKNRDRPAPASATQNVAWYARKGACKPLSAEPLSPLNTAVEMPSPILEQTRETVLNMPPATDCCSDGKDDITYIFVTVNSKSAPITDNTKEGKVNAHQELPAGMALISALEIVNATAPMIISSLLLTRCMTSAAMKLTIKPPTACGRSLSATSSGEQRSIRCQMSVSQKILFEKP